MNESDYFLGGKCSCYGFVLENSSSVSGKREKENLLILSVDPNTSPPLFSPQQWMSRGVWLPSILRTTGTFQESPRDPFRRGDWALCPAFPRPSGGLKGNEDHAAGGWSTWRHRVGVCVRAYVCMCTSFGEVFLCRHTGGDSKDCSSHHLWWPQGSCCCLWHTCFFWTLLLWTLNLNSITVANDTAPGKKRFGFFLKLLWLYTSPL